MSKASKQQDNQILRPRHDTLDIDGVISYGESQRVWNTIKLKNNLLTEFPQLFERRKKFGYRMVMHRSYKDLKKAIKTMEANEDVIPILLFFYKREDSNEQQ